MSEGTERKLELSPSMAIWYVSLDDIKERDKNARVMESDKFKQLVHNIKDEGMLESLPLLHTIGEGKFEIISGHHRVRASRQAGIFVIPAIVIERDMTEDEITSKQLSHNALSGYDNKDILNELYDSIEDFEQRLKSGLTDMELKMDEPTIGLVNIDVDFSFEPIYIMFMRQGVENFEELIDSLEPDAKKYLANMTEFNKFAKTVQAVSKYKDIRNIAGIVSMICDLAKERLNELKEEDAQNEQPDGD